MPKKLAAEVNQFINKCSNIVSDYECESFNVDLWDFCACGNVDSPIEHFFYSAISVLVRTNALEHEIVLTPKNGPRHRGVSISPQCPIGKYFVDFLVEYSGYGAQGEITESKVIVECDSQSFHERSETERRYEKKRDRFFANQGIHAFHFTGAEIMREPFRVASEVLSYLTKLDAKELIDPNFIDE